LRYGVVALVCAMLRSMSTQDRLAVNVREAAAMLGISPRSVQSHIQRKNLRSRKIGKRTLILVRDLEAFLKRDQPSPACGRRAVA
jgi:excisionase family DNA binding protein